MPEDRKGVMAIGELAEGMFESIKVVMRRPWWWLFSRLGRHNAPLSMGKKIPS
jgi:hypothetical protein